jgi:type 2 lantibiotic biosynthesis protein LanM
MNYLEIGKALTIEERIGLTKNKISNDNNFENVKKWINRKTTVDVELLYKILDINNWQPDEFNNSISEDFEIGYLDGENSFSELSSFIETINTENELPITYVRLVRPFIKKLGKNLLVEFDNKLSEKAIESIFDCLANRLINVSLKVFVLEMDFVKKTEGLQGETSEERFKYFIELFNDKEKLLYLYKKYPVMTRKMDIITSYFIDFINEFLHNLFQSWDLIVNTFFTTEKNLYIKDLIFEKGDTHEKGKSVVIIEFNSGKLVYKPRNLYIERNFKEIIDFFSFNDKFLKMDIPKAVYKPEFTFVQFIKQEPCKNEEEIKRYYQRYGQLIALIYLTNGSDIHFENIISHGEYPVIVDYETLFSVPINLEGGQENIFSEIVEFIRNSVSSSIMLPGKMQLDSEGNSVDISGLSGKSQKLEKKMYIPKDLGSDKAKYVLDNVVLEGSNNNVFYNDRIVSYQDYQDEIIFGFKNVMDFFLNNKEEYVALVENMENNIIRILARNTNTYAQFLEFTKHPHCLTDFLEVEKVLENLYTFPYENKKISQLEYKDMIFDDIPIFFSKLDENCIYNSAGVGVQNVFKNTPRKYLIEKIKNVDSKVISKQIGIINMKIAGEEGMVNQELTSLMLDKEDSYLEIAEKIAEQLIRTAYIDKTEEHMTWLTVNDGVADEFDLGAANINFYDGLIGIAALFNSLYKVTKKKKYQVYFNYIVNTVLALLDPTQKDSAYVGFHSFLQLFDLIEEQDIYYDKITQYLNMLQQNIQNFLEKGDTVDWLLGYGGVIPLYLKVYKKTKDTQFLDYSIFLAQKIMLFVEKDLNVINNIGIGHGISGLLISMLELYIVTEDTQYLENIAKLNEKLSEDLVNENKNVISWCNGVLGYLLGQSYLEKYNIDSLVSKKERHELLEKINTQMFESDCLCHGNCGRIQFYIDLYLIENTPEYLEQAKVFGDRMIQEFIENNYIKVKNFQGFTNIDLFKGISGIAYTMLRLLEPDNVPSVFI